MSSGPEHYKAAEALLARAQGVDEEFARHLVAEAQVHATLAAAAASCRVRMSSASVSAWGEVLA